MVRNSTQHILRVLFIITWKWQEYLLELQKLLLASVTCIVYKLQEDVAESDYAGDHPVGPWSTSLTVVATNHTQFIFPPGPFPPLS